MDSKSLIGRWRIAPELVGYFGDYAMEFTPFDELVYTYFDDEGKIKSRSLLTYRVEGNILITDQPSNPRQDQTLIQLEDNDLILLDKGVPAIFNRELELPSSDRDAYMLALSSSAIQHALGSVHKDAPFIPFLMADTIQGRTLVRFVAHSPQDAHLRAKEYTLSEKGNIKACVYTYDGYVTMQSRRSDAVILEVSQDGLDHGLMLAQPYTIANDEVVRIDTFAMQTSDSWL